MVTANEVNDFRTYRQYIKELVDCIVHEYEEYDSVDIHEQIWTTVDSSQIIMYYSNNLKVLEYSDNEPEEWKHLVDDTSYWKDVIQAMAYDVMKIDLYEELQDREEIEL